MVLPDHAAGRTARGDQDPGLNLAAASFEARYGTGPGAPVVVVIAALDEAGSIADVVRTVPHTVEIEGRAGLGVDCLVIDDGSSDGTARLAEEAGALVCRMVRNRGQGTALRLGYRLASARGAEVIVTMDADGQFDPSELPRLVEPVLTGRADFVNGSRRLGRADRADPVRSAGVTLFGLLISVLTARRITDPANGFRAFRPAVVEAVPQRQAQYQTAELLIGAAALGFRIQEAPVTVRSRAAGASKKGSNLRYGLRFTRVVLGTWWSVMARPRLERMAREPKRRR